MVERVRRAWICGVQDKAKLDGQPVPHELVISIDLPATYFVVVKAKNQRSCAVRLQEVLSGAELGNEFPSETEARAYITALGFAHLTGV